MSFFILNQKLMNVWRTYQAVHNSVTILLGVTTAVALLATVSVQTTIPALVTIKILVMKEF